MKKNREKKKKSVIGEILWWFTIVITVGVFLFCAYKLVTIWLEYEQGVEEYDDLSQFATAPAEITTEDGDEGTTQVEEDPGPIIDFAALKAVNEDVIGWIQVEAIENINYPIVQGKDNDYYLHRTVKKTYNFAGSIFLDSTNKPDFSDPHSVVFGHNMKNGSMFGNLKEFNEKEVFEKSRYFWICTPQKNYKYEIFSVHEAISGGEAYLLFSGQGQEVVDFAKDMKAASNIVTPDITFKPDSKIVTLSTCTTNTARRLIVQGIRVN